MNPPVYARLQRGLASRSGAATVLTLDNGQVIQVQYLQTEAQLRQALALTP